MAVIYVDDDATICWLMVREWKSAFPDLPLHTARTPLDALAKVHDAGPALVAVVVDWRLTGTTAEKLVQDLRRQRPDLCIIATSAVMDPQEINAARKAGADRFIEKDLSMQVFVRQMAQAIETVRKSRGGATPPQSGPALSDL